MALDRSNSVWIVVMKNWIKFSLFYQGNSQYNDRLEDIKLLKIEIKNLRSQRNLLARGSANTADMRQEVLQLNRVLVQERVRARALENEMTTPMNVHRWRKLSGCDPEKAELLTKVQTLQKFVEWNLRNLKDFKNYFCQAIVVSNIGACEERRNYSKHHRESSLSWRSNDETAEPAEH